MAKTQTKLNYSSLVSEFEEKEESYSNIFVSPEIEKRYNDLWENAEKNMMKIPMEQIVSFNQPFKINPSKVFALKKTISKVGLIQPIIVRRISEKEYQILSGHHRYTACKELGYATIECIVVSCKDDQDAKCIVVFANIQRDQPTPLETARLIQSLKDEKDENGEDYNAESIADLYSISKRTVYRLEHLLELDESLQELVDIGIISTLSIEKINKYLSAEQQNVLNEYYEKKKKKYSQKDIDKVVEHVVRNKSLSLTEIELLLSPKKRAPKQFKNELFNSLGSVCNIEMSEQELNELAFRLLKEYFDNQ